MKRLVLFALALAVLSSGAPYAQDESGGDDNSDLVATDSATSSGDFSDAPSEGGLDASAAQSCAVDAGSADCAASMDPACLADPALPQCAAPSSDIDAFANANDDLNSTAGQASCTTISDCFRPIR